MGERWNYYECEPGKESDPAHFSRNYVQFPTVIKGLTWLESGARKLGFNPLSLETELLREFDQGANLRACLGTRAELERLRDLVQLFARHIDANPYLSTPGRMMLRGTSLGELQGGRQMLQFFHENRVFIEKNGKLRTPVISRGCRALAPHSSTA